MDEVFYPAATGQRGCGKSRKKGGVYWETGIGPGGSPKEHFQVCPPIIPPAEWRIQPRGVKLVQDQHGTWHIVDWIGSQFYPNVADYIEEFAHMGASRRLPENLQFEKLTDASCLLMVHARAYILNWDEYRDAGVKWTCPKRHRHHVPEECTECCAGLYYEDVEHGIPYVPGLPMGTGVLDTLAQEFILKAHDFGTSREIMRTIPCCSYRARRRPDAVKKPIYVPAIFMRSRASRLAVVKNDGDKHVKALGNAKKAKLRVDEVDE